MSAAAGQILARRSRADIYRGMFVFISVVRGSHGEPAEECGGVFVERIICDTYIKGKKHVWPADKDDWSSQEFNRKILAANEMYGWLYEKGILRDVAFEIKDYPEVTFFALDVKRLEPYREAMEQAGLKDAQLAVRHIFDEYYTPCEYSGAIELGWTMAGYRDVDGCVGRSWECGLLKGLNARAAHDVLRVLDEKGVHAAVHEAFQLAGFKPDLFQQAFEHYAAIDRSMADYKEYLDYHGDKLIYCFQKGLSLDLIDVDFWVQYEWLLGERLTHDEYMSVDSAFDGDPHEIAGADEALIGSLREALIRCREGKAKDSKGEGVQDIIENAQLRSDGRAESLPVGKDLEERLPPQGK